MKTPENKPPPEIVAPDPEFVVDGLGTLPAPSSPIAKKIVIPKVTEIFKGFQVDQQPFVTRQVKCIVKMPIRFPLTE